MNLYKNILFLLLITFSISVVNAQDSESKNYLLEQQLPDWFLSFYKTAKIDSSYQISDYINPFYIEADFNGDGKTDIAVLIEENKTKKKGILICHSTTKKFFILGAGKKFDNGDDDFGWMDIWKVYRKTKVETGAGESKIFTLKGQAIWVEKSESASAIIYWNGQNYKWYQQGD